MPRPFSALAEPPWTPDLACLLERAATAFARPNSRICASLFAETWHWRSAWAGLARALQCQGEEIEEVDIFAAEMDVVLPQRHLLTRGLEVLDELATLRKALAPTDDLGAIALPSPSVRADAPALLRALEAAAVHARSHDGTASWTRLPLALAALKLTHRPLALFAGGDKAWRPARSMSLGEREAIVRRYLKENARAADDGLDLLEELERYRTACAAALAREARPGALRPLAALLIERPLLAPLAVAEALGLTISGAGKLLARAAALGMVHEISGRGSWKLYCASDLAIRYGFAARTRGRPPALPTPSDPLSSVLAKFDEEMAAIDALLGH